MFCAIDSTFVFSIEINARFTTSTDKFSPYSRTQTLMLCLIHGLRCPAPASFSPSLHPKKYLHTATFFFSFTVLHKNVKKLKKVPAAGIQPATPQLTFD